MAQLFSNIRSFSRLATLILLLTALRYTVSAQAPTISYPTAAQNITRAFASSDLTLKLVFNGICAGATSVRVALPSSVTYVPGTISKVSGTGALSIAESSITDLRNPVFSISGLSAIGDEIVFSLARRGACGSLSSAKDSIFVLSSSGCSSASEISGTVNSYNILAPSLALTAPAALVNTVVGATTTRSITITNGGTGDLDTLRFYIVYPSAGIVNTSGTNAISANSVSFTPIRTSGDTLFYNIFGSTIFSGNNRLSNGETVTITEPIRVAKCNTITTYAAYWSPTAWPACQTASGTSSMTMLTGTPALTIVTTDSTVARACTPGISRIVYTNTGTGGANAGTAYNVIANLGFNALSTSTLFRTSNGELLSDFTYGARPGVGTALTVTTPATAFVANMNQFVTDPDGAGAGLDDLDGDGQFDDLAPGKSFSIYFLRTYTPSSTCPRPNYVHVISTIVNYTTMCGTAVTTLADDAAGGRNSYYSSLSRTTTIDPLVIGGNPFTVTISNSASWVMPISQVVDSFILSLTLPSGISYAGNARYRGVALAASDVVVSGSQLTLYRKSNNIVNPASPYQFTVDLVYDCTSGSGVFSVPFELVYVNDRSCSVIERLYCSTFDVNALCPAAVCPNGIGNTNIIVKRQSLGWTDTSMATRVLASSLSRESLSTVAALDTLNITSAGRQGTITYSNLHYRFEISKSSGDSVLQFVSGTLNYKSPSGAAVSTPIAAPASASTASLTIWNWNLSSLLGTAGIPASMSAGDSVWVSVTYVVTRANSSQLFGITTPSFAPVALAYLYSLDGTGTARFCNQLIPAVRFVGYTRPVTVFAANAGEGRLGSCNSVFIRVDLRGGHSNVAQPFPGEYRPKIYLDSLVITLPPGVLYDSAILPTYDYTVYTTVFGYVVRSRTIGHPIIRGQDLIFVNPGNWKMSDFTQLNSNDNRILFYVRQGPSLCITSTGSLPVGVKHYGRDYQWVSSTIPSNLTITPFNNGSLTVNTSIRPTLTVQNNTGTVQGVNVNHHWDVQVNSTGTSTAPYLWVSFECSTGSGGIIVDSVKLLPGLTTVPLTGSFNTSDKWYQISTAGLASGANQQLRVFFRYSSCNLDSVAFKAGWNCSTYPSPDPGSLACPAATTFLKVNPQNSEVQLSVLRQPGGGSSIPLCTIDSTLLLVNSAQAGNLVNPYISFFPPAGFTLSTPVRVEYPLGSGHYQNATLSSLPGGGVKIDLSAHTGIGSSGMLGTANANPSFVPLGGDRQAKVVVRYSVDCDFVSGNSFVFFGFGNRTCGTAASGSGVSATTSGLNISGSSSVGGAGALINIDETSISCSGSATLSLTTVPTTLATQLGDTMIYTLPSGIGYAGAFVRGTNCSSCEISIAPGLGGTTIVKVKLHPGVAASSALSYSFDITPTGADCGTLNVNGVFKRLISPLSCGATLCSSSSIIIGSTNSPSVLIKKPYLQVLSYTLLDTSIWLGGASVNRVKIKYSNTGTMAYTANTDSVELFCGTGSIPFAVLPLSKNLAIGAVDSDSYTITLPASACSMADLISTTAKIQTTNSSGRAQCLCNSSTQVLTVPPAVIPVMNYCQGATATALSAIGSSLKWYTSPTGGTPDTTAPTPLTTTAGATNYYVSQTSATGTESPRALITVIVRAAPPAPTVISPLNYCQGSPATALVATKLSASDTLIWYSSSTATSGSLIAPTPGTSSVGSTNYFVGLKSEYGCLGPRSVISVNVNPIPAAPVVVTPIAYCKDATAVPLSASAGSSSDTLLWYTVALGGAGTKSAIVPATASVGSTNYYVSQKSAFGCESPRASITVNINPLPSISGVTSACVGDTATLIGSATAHASTPWTSSNNAVATVSGTGLLTAVSAGTTTITYRNNNNCTNTVIFTVNPLPTISGIVTACAGSSSTLTGSASAHPTSPWTSSNTAVATVSAAGVVNAVSAGSTIITYRNTNNCTQTATFTVNALPTISGTLSACVGSTSSLSGSATAHPTSPWTSSNTAVASISSTGVVTAISSGTCIISYKNTNDCIQTATFTVNPLPTISGTLNTCIGSTSSLTGTATPHPTAAWTSSNTSIASVSGTGVVTGISAGSVTITYRNSNDCIVTASFTVNALPTISGTAVACVGQTSTLTGSATAHPASPWTSSSTAVATVSSTGVVTGISAGTAIITYQNSNGCTIGQLFTVNALPFISGANSVCQGQKTTLTGSATPHPSAAWTSSNTAVATISGSGEVSGISVGTTSISYKNSNDCIQTITFTVNPLPSAPTVISPLNLCIGSPASALTASGTALKWYTSDTGSVALASAPVPNTSVLGTTNYYVSQTNSFGCEGSRALLQVVVQPLPLVSISSLSKSGFVLCRNSNVILKANAPTAISYQWALDATNRAGAIFDTTVADSAGKWSVKVSDIYGCKASAEVMLTKDISSIPVLSPTDLMICKEGSGLLTCSPGFVSYTFEWIKDGLPLLPTTTKDNLKNVTGPGAYKVIVTNNVGCVDTTNSSLVTNYAIPIKPVINNLDPILEVTKTYSFYRWFKNGAAIIGANSFNYITTASGFYHVEVSDKNGCLNYSDTVEIKNKTAINFIGSQLAFLKIYPNPTWDMLHIEAPLRVNVKVFDMQGKLIFEAKAVQTINMSEYAQGTYVLKISDEYNNLIAIQKIIKLP